jgi:hypothetical protein
MAKLKMGERISWKAACAAAEGVETMTQQQIDTLAKQFAYLYDRWQDESQYEDFADYRNAFAAKLPAGATVKSFTPRPFRADIVVAGERYTFKADATSVTVHTLKDARQ